jgi:DNA-binding IclR family transcriptional regulator
MVSLQERGEVGKSGVGVLDKSVLILSFLSEAGSSSLAEVVEGTNLPRPTAHRLLAALEAHHLVAREGRKYALGMRLLGWGARAAPARDLVEASRPVLKRLRDETGESTQLYVREGDHRVCVASSERASGGLRDTVHVGAIMPLARGSAGKVLLAWADDGAEHRGAAELDGVKTLGWAESVAEREAGVASVSAPVFGEGGKLLAAVSASGPISRIGESPGEHLADAVVAAARGIERISG